MENLQSQDVEQALLGTFLVFNKSITRAIEAGLIRDYFYLDNHAIIFDVISELGNKGVLTDVIAVQERLKELNEYNRIGGIEYLEALTAVGATQSTINHNVDILEGKHQIRRIMKITGDIQDAVKHGGVDPNELLEQAEREILQVSRSRRTGAFESLKDSVPEVLENIRVKSEAGTSVTGLRTGFNDLDYLTGGLKQGELIILGARPAVGKSAFAVNLAVNATAINKVPTAIFSLEMPTSQLIERMLASQGDIDGTKLRDGNLRGDDDWNKLYKAGTDLQAYDIYIDDNSSLKMSEVFAKCRKLKSDKGLGLIVIDYLQLMTGSSKRDNRQNEVAEISRQLKVLARELEVPVIALSQLSRGLESRDDQKPRLSDLRESGAIEQDADIVAFLYREAYHNNDEAQTDSEQTDILVAKNRSGSLGTVSLMFKKSRSKFYPMVRSH